jgi:hypothetical protein
MLALTRVTASTAHDPVVAESLAPVHDLSGRGASRPRAMSVWLLSVLERLPTRARRVAIATSGLVVVGAVMVALTLAPSRAGGGRPPRAARRAQAERTPTRIEQQRVAPPVSTPQLLRARGVAEWFLGSYVRFAYGRGDALAGPVTPALRRQLARERAQITPVERHQRPRFVSLQVVGTTPGFVVATAIVKDEGFSASRLRFTLAMKAGRWAVFSVVEG